MPPVRFFSASRVCFDASRHAEAEGRAAWSAALTSCSSRLVCLFLSEGPQTLRVRRSEDVTQIAKAKGGRTTCNTISVPVKSSWMTVTAQNRNISPKIHLIFTYFTATLQFLQEVQTDLDVDGGCKQRTKSSASDYGASMRHCCSTSICMSLKLVL